MFLAKLLSRLLHPIFVPTITLAIISTKFLNIIILSNQLNIIIIGTVIFTLLFPLLSILYLLFTKRIKSLQIEEKEERILPILFTIIWMLIGYYFLGNILELVSPGRHGIHDVDVSSGRFQCHNLLVQIHR